MIKFTTGNIVKSETEALVNTVNTVGVMGKGIALAMKNAFPNNFKIYEKACKDGSIDIGKLLITETGKLFPKYIINFPTKRDWRKSSEYSFIDLGLKDLIRILKHYKIKSISIPPLGAGNGRLNWYVVKKMIIDYLERFNKDIDIIIYEPGYQDQIILNKKEVALNPIRVMFLYLLKQYQVLGYEINLLVAQKIAYFMQRFDEKLDLSFEKGIYGPYAHKLNHLLKYLNNVFIYYNEQENKPITEIQLLPDKLDEIEKQYQVLLSNEQKIRTERLLNFIEGFESPFGLELLATIDFISNQTNKKELTEIESEIGNWTKRKRELMSPHHINVAYKRLREFNLI